MLEIRSLGLPFVMIDSTPFLRTKPVQHVHQFHHKDHSATPDLILAVLTPLYFGRLVPVISTLLIAIRYLRMFCRIRIATNCSSSFMLVIVKETIPLFGSNTAGTEL